MKMYDKGLKMNLRGLSARFDLCKLVAYSFQELGISRSYSELPTFLQFKSVHFSFSFVNHRLSRSERFVPDSHFKIYFTRGKGRVEVANKGSYILNMQFFFRS